MAEPEKDQIGDGQDNFGQAAGKAIQAAKLHFTPVGQIGGDDVLRNVPGKIRPAPVNLGGILPGKRTAAMTGTAAVGIRNQLTPRNAGIRRRAAHDEPPCGIDEELGVLIDQRGGDRRQDHMPQNVVPQRVNVNAFPVLAGHDDRRHPARPVLPVVFHRDLRFPVGEKILQFIAAAHQLQPLRQRVGQLDGQRHPVDGFLTGISFVPLWSCTNV